MDRRLLRGSWGARVSAACPTDRTERAPRWRPTSAGRLRRSKPSRCNTTRSCSARSHGSTRRKGTRLQAGLYKNPRFDTNNPQVFSGSTTNLNAGFVQEFSVKGKMRLDKAAANQVVRQKEFGMLQDRFEVQAAIRQQFYTVMAARRRVVVRSEIREIAAAAFHAAQARQPGRRNRPVRRPAPANRDASAVENSLRNAETTLAAGRRQLAAIIGRPDLSIDRLAADLTSGFPEFNADYLRQFVVSENVQVQIARREIDRNQILLQRARVEPYPNPTFGPATVYNIQQTTNSQQFWFNIYFDIPTWNRNQGNIQSTRADIVDATASLGVLQNDLIRQAEDALGRYRVARQTEERLPHANPADSPAGRPIGARRISEKRARHFHLFAGPAGAVGRLVELCRRAGRSLDHGGRDRRAIAIGAFSLMSSPHAEHRPQALDI